MLNKHFWPPYRTQKNEDDDSTSTATQLSISKRGPLLRIRTSQLDYLPLRQKYAVTDTENNWFPSPLCFMSALLQVEVLRIWSFYKTISSHPTIPFKSAERNLVSHPYSLLHIYFDLCLNLDMQTLSVPVNYICYFVQNGRKHVPWMNSGEKYWHQLKIVSLCMYL